jgi:hypothetical protein
MGGHRSKGGKFEGRRDLRIVLIEVWPCQNKDELRRREQYYIDHAMTLFPNVELRNESRAFATPEQNRERHVRYNATEKGAATKKRFYDTKKGEASLAWFKAKVTCGCGRTVMRGSVSPHKRSNVHKTWESM